MQKFGWKGCFKVLLAMNLGQNNFIFLLNHRVLKKLLTENLISNCPKGCNSPNLKVLYKVGGNPAGWWQTNLSQSSHTQLFDKFYFYLILSIMCVKSSLKCITKSYDFHNPSYLHAILQMKQKDIFYKIKQFSCSRIEHKAEGIGSSIFFIKYLN